MRRTSLRAYGVAAGLAFAAGLLAGQLSMPWITGDIARGQSVKEVRPCDGVRVSAEQYGRYVFTEDFFHQAVKLWPVVLAPFRDRPVHYLEIGVFQGRSLIWMLENILVHKDSRATAIDIEVAPLLGQNLARTGACAKVRVIADSSQRSLRMLPAKEAFDVIYIDGSHSADDVMADAVLAFDLLKIGGVMIFDDYDWNPDRPSELRPQVAVDAFLTAYRHRLRMIHRHYQVIVQKRAHPCPADKESMSPVGEYCFNWSKGELSRQSDGQRAATSPAERELIEAFARSPRFGEVAPVVDAKLRAQRGFEGLERRLKIGGS
jgi:predicted O-methyltransferase YrrM